ncbi:hypothetical protein HISP_09075 [Haloarcula hispanica N601]|uniref:Uncharacterized protein n=1 Tax=Haloarcula hispanica N601 TaxID=1417673 RepID=V5TS67_HALHI|nr:MULTISPECIES: hypothetical protein [Haloarcula]AHB67495.1 hypothetical protein HISP_09075 [Haloarcula hispanica N601]
MDAALLNADTSPETAIRCCSSMSSWSVSVADRTGSGVSTMS